MVFSSAEPEVDDTPPGVAPWVSPVVGAGLADELVALEASTVVGAGLADELGSALGLATEVGKPGANR